MATGFVQRYKGKIAAAQVRVPVGGLMIADVAVNAAGADLNGLIGWSSAPTSTSSTAAPVQLSTTRVNGIDTLAPVALTGGSIYRLPAPTVGAEKIIVYSTINGSTVIFLSASTAGAVVYAGVGSTGSTASFFGSGGSTISNTLKSTQSCQITMFGLSTTQWLITAVAPSTVGALTFSTST